MPAEIKPADPKKISLIVGLGNPGAEHISDRHNAGFHWTDSLVADHNGEWKAESKFFGRVARIQIANRQVWCLQPTTYMNLSGRSILAFCHFYKIPVEEILIVHDELDLPPGVARYKWAGGHGGHNGLRDFFKQLGSRDCWRVRLGVGHPGHKSQVAAYVCSKASAADQNSIQIAQEDSLRLLECFLEGDAEGVMKQLHTDEKKI